MPPSSPPAMPHSAGRSACARAPIRETGIAPRPVATAVPVAARTRISTGHHSRCGPAVVELDRPMRMAPTTFIVGFVSDQRQVVIAGGGIAGLEALMALRDLGGDRLALTLVAPDPEFTYKPFTVEEPFSFKPA